MDSWKELLPELGDIQLKTFGILMKQDVSGMYT